MTTKTAQMAQVELMKSQVGQLKVEANIQRKLVSEVARELIDYCEKQRASDPLMTGISDSHNPFQEKKTCNIL